ncbi:MAG: hypothetical protein WDZ35_15185 [Crocinitomicaceae bacterium]
MTIRFLFFFITFQILFSCKNENSTVSKKDVSEIKIIENELIKLIEKQLKVTMKGDEDDYDQWISHISEDYKHAIADSLGDSVKIENTDALFRDAYKSASDGMKQLKKDGWKIKIKMVGIADKIIKGDTLIYLVEDKLTAVERSGLNKRSITGYTLATSTNYGKKWFFYIPEVTFLEKVLKKEIGDSLTQSTLVFLRKRQLQGIKVR